MILAIDFDGVIHDYKNPVEGRRMGGPIEGAKEKLHKYQRQGHKVIVFTVRACTDGGIKCVKDWMEYYDIKYDDITNIKVDADYYIDDKAIKFIGWDEVKIK